MTVPNPYSGLRQLVLDLSPSEGDSPLLAALFELGMTGGSATISCVADGTVSMYLSGGGASLGMGGVEAVRAAAAEYLRVVAAEVQNLEEVDKAVPPAEGMVQVVAVTSAGLRMVRMPFPLAQDPEFAGHGLWVAGQEVISQIRMAN